jgi:hypothetical protein
VTHLGRWRVIGSVAMLVLLAACSSGGNSKASSPENATGLAAAIRKIGGPRIGAGAPAVSPVDISDVCRRNLGSGFSAFIKQLSAVPAPPGLRVPKLTLTSVRVRNVHHGTGEADVQWKASGSATTPNVITGHTSGWSLYRYEHGGWRLDPCTPSTARGSGSTLPAPIVPPGCPATTSANIVVWADPGLSHGQLAALDARIARQKHADRVCAGPALRLAPTGARGPSLLYIWIGRGTDPQRLASNLMGLRGVQEAMPLPAFRVDCNVRPYFCNTSTAKPPFTTAPTQVPTP